MTDGRRDSRCRPGAGLPRGRLPRAGGPIRILISACLLGEEVRYDGGHKRDPFLVETLGKFVEYIPVCPEVDCGLPTPREAMRLVGDPASPRLVTARSGVDHTERMRRWARARLAELARLDLWAYICKKDSPSSGMRGVKVYGAPGIAAMRGAGIFTKAFMERFPLVPVEEEGRLHDPALREDFIERIFTLKRYRALLAAGKNRARLADFHADHELLVRSRDRRLCAEMGKLVARAREVALDDLFARYARLLVEVLGRKRTPGKCADVLLRAMRRLKGRLAAGESRRLLDMIAAYRRRLLPLVVPVMVLRHYAREHGVAHLERQLFLSPDLAELTIRNQV